MTIKYHIQQRHEKKYQTINVCKTFKQASHLANKPYYRFQPTRIVEVITKVINWKQAK
jgi:hypothetical protein